MLFNSILKFWQYFLKFFELFFFSSLYQWPIKKIFFLVLMLFSIFFPFKIYSSNEGLDLSKFKYFQALTRLVALSHKFWLEKEVENWRVTWKGYVNFAATNNLEKEGQNLILCIYLSVGLDDVYLTDLLCLFM